MLPNINLKSNTKKAIAPTKLRLDSLAKLDEPVLDQKQLKPVMMHQVDNALTNKLPVNIKFIKSARTPRHLRNYSLNTGNETSVKAKYTSARYDISSLFSLPVTARIAETSYIRDRHDLKKMTQKIKNIQQIEREPTEFYRMIKPSPQIKTELKYFINESAANSPRSPPKSPTSIKSEFLKFANISHTLEEFLARSKLQQERSKTSINKPQSSVAQRELLRPHIIRATNLFSF